MYSEVNHQKRLTFGLISGRAINIELRDEAEVARMSIVAVASTALEFS